jgi:prepilin-type processing-associated H-X9-DG protein
VLNLGSGNLVPGTDDGISTTANAIPVNKVVSAAGTAFLIESQGYATVFGQRNLANDTYMTCDAKGNLIPQDAFTNSLALMHGAKPKSRFSFSCFVPKPKPRVNVLMHDGHVECLDHATITAGKGMIMQYIK